MWSPDQHNQHHLETCQKCRFGGSASQLPNQKLWSWPRSLRVNQPHRWFRCMLIWESLGYVALVLIPGCSLESSSGTFNKIQYWGLTTRFQCNYSGVKPWHCRSFYSFSDWEPWFCSNLRRGSLIWKFMNKFKNNLLRTILWFYYSVHLGVLIHNRPQIM